MTPEEAEKACDALENKYSDLGLTYEQIVECAILHQTWIVDELESVWNEMPKISNYFWVVENRIVKAKQILETLKSRVK
jgi:hypothetical protein